MQLPTVIYLTAIIASFGQLLFKLTHEDRSCVRKLENETKKTINNHHAVVFNKTCINENLLPKYSNIYIYIYIYIYNV